jgi:hypothetical protein
MSSFTITRSAVIPASEADIYPLISNFHEWTKWSPWETVDPSMSRTYSGAESGAGATYAWSGKGRAGAGSMEITDATEPSSVAIRLTFTKPMKAVNRTTFTLAPDNGGTKVSWTMTGEHKGFGRIVMLFMSMDKLVGRDFEKGLASLATAVAAR